MDLKLKKHDNRGWKIGAGVLGGLLVAAGTAMLVSPQLRERVFSGFNQGEGVRGAGMGKGHKTSSLRDRARRSRQHAEDVFESNPNDSGELRRDVNILESDMDRTFDL